MTAGDNANEIRNCDEVHFKCEQQVDTHNVRMKWRIVGNVLPFDISPEQDLLNCLTHTHLLRLVNFKRCQLALGMGNTSNISLQRLVNVGCPVVQADRIGSVTFVLEM